ncbi:tRNA 5-methylaminomethyl-2-thiouridylate-methyltransferase [Gloeophyllum trabeum ATCC 11539]|uniref:tRNA-5-taurinomethyluridine 2-sulfurtransferase n=1 Tax=Gloeophyllum trabeum (strain ATCC 11539 / FP-39264 / Madison 617) TaxID=670483 RepID=S7RSV8_GLOTA|nr:tRNA 5-methylaminomethyl-2-thiouridylate-methyltransferase [Gloeophyllum trabeum ATCC 11539]EPQ57770.1 tRNA 5-methylaminomethyl-2-thiouridylate-methyltransferase [Gloeophyllum trabeum ATCC 11539]
MSGGVDSSVTAKLLADQNYDLSAVFMRNWDTRDESGTDKGCEWEKDWEDVQRVCKMLDLPCTMVDLTREYWTRVFEPSLQLWESGLTPNPDVWCNREVKFGALLDRLTPSTRWLATGHYARKEWTQSFTPASSSSSDLYEMRIRPQLLKATDRHKDQTYYLSSIKEDSLRKALFPLGDLTKPEVRAMAKRFGLPTAERAESMGICFVGEKRKFSEFVSQYVPPKPGDIVDLETGKVVGQHQGLWTYTIGQGAKIRGLPEKAFVAKKDPKSNVVYVVPGSDHPALYSDVMTVKDFEWIWPDSPPLAVFEPDGFRARVKYRYVMEDVPATICRTDESKMRVTFDQPQKAVTPGQIAAVYHGDWCLGCGLIEEASQR